MYPSDYGYTFAKGVDDTCYANLNKCSPSIGSGVPENSWLYKLGQDQWTLAPYSNDEWSVFDVGVSGNFASNGGAVGLTYGRGVRPVVYLKSDIKLSGWGTKTDPYNIKSE